MISPWQTKGCRLYGAFVWWRYIHNTWERPLCEEHDTVHYQLWARGRLHTCVQIATIVYSEYPPYNGHYGDRFAGNKGFVTNEN